MDYNEGIYNWENTILRDHSERIFSFYMGCIPPIGKVMNSPLRKDEIPSFGIFMGVNELVYKDFATGESGDCIKFVQEVLHISRREAVIKILVDVFRSNLSTSDIKVIPTYHLHKNSVSIGLKMTSFNNADLEYWGSYGVTEKTLNLYNVKSVSHVWVNDKLIFTKDIKNPIYAYIESERVKVYRPLSDKKSKWLGNSNNSCIFGIDNIPWIGDLLIITKSLKDVMVLYELGYDSISPNGETTLLPKKIIEQLQKRFKNIIVFLDNDKAGIDTANKYKEQYELDLIFLPNKEKDISDYIKENGKEQTLKILSNIIDNNEKYIY